MTINQDLPEVIRTSEISSLASKFQNTHIAVPSAGDPDPLADIEKFFKYIDAFITRFDHIGKQIREMRGMEQQTPNYQESGYVSPRPATPSPPRVNAQGLYQSMLALMQQLPKETTVGEAVEYAEKNRTSIIALMQAQLDDTR